MALKFLNKKGWHTGSLRNIENVWKAEQKHDAEQRKLDELRKQIHEERERAEFRQLQEQAGLIPRQERLDFLYESGLAVGKGSSSFKELESLPKTDPGTTASSSAAAAVEKQPAVPGALFEDSKPQSANDTWRKLHSDPLLLIRQREQEALARVKNNPIQMAMIRKSVESKKDKKEKKHKTKQRNKSKHKKHSSSGDDSDSEGATLTAETQRDGRHRGSRSEKRSHKASYNSDEELSEGDARKKIRGSRSEKRSHKASQNSDEELSEGDARRKKFYDEEYKDRRPSGHSYSKYDKSYGGQTSKKSYYDSERKEPSERKAESHYDKRSHVSSSDKPPRNESNNRHRNPVKLSEEERAARLREMQMDAERHEEQRWKRLKKAAENDAQEAAHDRASLGRNFLDNAQKSVYGAEKGGSSTIEESVRRRMHYSQRKSATEGNAFRR